MSPEAQSAKEQLRQLGFRVQSHTGSYRLIRPDGSQAQLYRADGKLDVTGNLGNVGVSHGFEAELDAAVLRALPIAQAILDDEARRLALGNMTFGKAL